MTLFSLLQTDAMIGCSHEYFRPCRAVLNEMCFRLTIPIWTVDDALSARIVIPLASDGRFGFGSDAVF